MCTHRQTIIKRQHRQAVHYNKMMMKQVGQDQMVIVEITILRNALDVEYHVSIYMLLMLEQQSPSCVLVAIITGGTK